LKALGHPVRHRILTVLRQRPATLRQLADALGVGKGTVAYHVGTLRDAGLVSLGETRRVRGGTEQYFSLPTRNFRVDSPRPLLQAALDELVDPENDQPEHTVLRHLWITRARAAALAAELESFAADRGTTDEDGDPYMLLLSLSPVDIPRLPADGSSRVTPTRDSAISPAPTTQPRRRNRKRSTDR
jgi:DNA-binding transcriptional ArsR family regulator